MTEPSLCEVPKPNDAANALFKKWIRGRGYKDNLSDTCFGVSEVAEQLNITKIQATFVIIEVLGKTKVSGFSYYGFEKIVLSTKPVIKTKTVSEQLQEKYKHLSFNPRHKVFTSEMLQKELLVSKAMISLIGGSLPMNFHQFQKIVLSNLS